jgi:hypothetical protein
VGLSLIAVPMPRSHVSRLVIVALVAACGLAAFAGSADARPWRRGWPGWGPYPAWGYPWGWPYPPGGYYGPSAVWYVPPPPEPIVLPRKRCPAGRVPARWVPVRKDGRVIYQHVPSRCR